MKKAVILVIMGLMLFSWPSAALKAGDVSKYAVNNVGTGIWAGKRVLYYNAFKSFALEYKDVFRTQLINFISMNPSPTGSVALRSAIGFFINLLQPFYVLAILLSAFHLLFLSSSTEDRYRVKSMLTTLLAGMVVISLSPAILQMFLDISESITRVILGLTDVNIVLDSMDASVENIATFFLLVTAVDMSLGFYTAVPILLLVWGVFFILFLRYAIVTLFCIIFPLTVFFYSFNLTRPVGRNMMEQTILWTVIQEFNAVIIAVMGVAISTRPGDFMRLSIAIYPDFDFLALSATFMLIAAPLLVLRLFRNFLP